MFADWLDPVLTSLRECAALSRRARASALRDGRIQRVRHGKYIGSDCLELADQPWQCREIGLTARVLSLDDGEPCGPVLVGPAAAFATGLRLYPTPGDVDLLVSYPTNSQTRDFSRLRWADGYILRPGRLRRYKSPFPEHLILDIPRTKLRALHPIPNTVWCAAREDPELATIIACETLGGSEGFPYENPEAFRANERRIRCDMESWIDRRRRWILDPDTALWVIDNSDGGCESPSEGRGLFQLKSRGVLGVTTQHCIPTRNRPRYADLAIVRSLVDAEHEGEDKDGDTVEAVHSAQTRRDRRYMDIRAAGWEVVPVRRTTLNVEGQLLEDVHAAAKRPLLIIPSQGLPASGQSRITSPSRFRSARGSSTEMSPFDPTETEPEWLEDGPF